MKYRVTKKIVLSGDLTLERNEILTDKKIGNAILNALEVAGKIQIEGLALRPLVWIVFFREEGAILNKGQKYTTKYAVRKVVSSLEKRGILQKVSTKKRKD